MAEAILFAVSLTILNALSSILIANYAIKKKWKTFNRWVFGSMVVRYFLTAAIVVYVIKYLKLNKLAFALTFLIFTFILIIVEILFIHNRAKSINLKNKNRLN